ncbi:MAG: hypothetical protein JWR26_3222 [Pedosphaera sp.]|nr:hypothetical protein [Pedosphaera sp.]
MKIVKKTNRTVLCLLAALAMTAPIALRADSTNA